MFILACGMTHVMSIITFWDPIYGWSAIVKMITAAVSVLTAILIWMLLSTIIKIPTIWQIEDIKNKYHLLLESTAEGIYGLNTKGEMTFMNAAATSMLGYRKEELLGKSVHPMIHHPYPDGSPYPVEQCPMYGAFKRGKKYNIDNELLWRKDGSSFWVSYSSTPIYDHSELVGAVVIFSDITEKKVATNKANNFYKFSVEDDGPGVPEEYRNKIFDMFQTLKSRDEVEASGIGLAIVKKTVEWQGGEVWVESGKERGAKFIFTWPINKEE